MFLISIIEFNIESKYSISRARNYDDRVFITKRACEAIQLIITIACVMIIIISFRYTSKKLIIITKNDVSDLNLNKFYETFIIKIKVIFIIISKSFKFELKNLNEMFIDDEENVTFINKRSSKKRRNYIVIV